MGKIPDLSASGDAFRAKNGKFENVPENVPPHLRTYPEFAISIMVSEALILAVAAMGCGMAAAGMWYGRSILLTSRCVEVSCCCLRWKNQPLSGSELVNVIDHEGPPPTVPGISDPGNRRQSIGV